MRVGRGKEIGRTKKGSRRVGARWLVGEATPSLAGPRSHELETPSISAACAPQSPRGRLAARHAGKSASERGFPPFSSLSPLPRATVTTHHLASAALSVRVSLSRALTAARDTQSSLVRSPSTFGTGDEAIIDIPPQRMNANDSTLMHALLPSAARQDGARNEYG